MKTTFTTIAVLLGMQILSAQEQEINKQIEKKIIVSVDENGEKQMTISTTQDGKTTTEQFSGEAVDAQQNQISIESHHPIHQYAESDASNIEVDVMVITQGDEDPLSKTEKKVVVKTCTNIDELMGFDIEKYLSETIEKQLQQDIEIKHHVENEANMKVLHDEEVYEDVENIGDLLKQIGVESPKEEINNVKKVTVKKIVVIEEHSSQDVEKKQSDNLDHLKMNIYPNPNEGKFTLELNKTKKGKATVSISDTNGKEVFSSIINTNGVSKTPVDLSGLAAGTYVTTVKQGKQVISQKILID